MRAWWFRVAVVCVALTTACASAHGAGPVLRQHHAAARPAVHLVRKGDTLYSIGRRHGLTVAQLMAFNGLSSHTLAVGARLRLSGAAKATSPKSKPKKVAKQMAVPARRSGALVSHSKPTVSTAAARKPVSQPVAAQSSTVAKAVAKPAQPKKSPLAKATAVVAAAPPPRRILRWPVSGIITSKFGLRGPHVHDGIDIGAPRGTQVRAAADGQVVFAKNHGGYGNLVIVQHANGIMTIYAHHDANLVQPGQKVRVGEVIARVGATGRATGPHLHFEVRRGARPENPLAYLPTRP